MNIKFKFLFFLIYRYIEDLTNGTYLQQTVESVVGNEAGKQLTVKNISINKSLSILYTCFIV